MKIHKYIAIILLVLFPVLAIAQAFSFEYKRLAFAYALFLIISLLILFFSKRNKKLALKIFVSFVLLFAIVNFVVFIPYSGFEGGSISENLRYSFKSPLPANNLYESNTQFSKSELLRQFFVTYLNPLLLGKEVHTDNSIHNSSELNYVSNNLVIDKNAAGISYDELNDLKAKYSYQSVIVKTNKKNIEICLFTGDDWNNSKIINLFYNDNSLVYIPDRISIKTVSSDFPEIYGIQEIEYNLFPDSSTSSLFENNLNDKVTHIIKQIAISLYFCLIAFLSLYGIKNKVKYNLFYSILFPFGIAMNIISFVFLSLLGLNINILSIVFTHIVLILFINVLTAHFIKTKENINTKNKQFLFLFVNLLLIVLAGIFSTPNQWGNDSLGSLNMAQRIFTLGKVGNNYLDLIALSWVHTSVHTTAINFGVIYYNSLSFTLYLSCSLSFIAMFYNFSISKGIVGKKAIVYTMAPILLVSSVPFIFAQYSIMLNNLAVALYCMMLCSFGALFLLQDKSNFSTNKVMLAIVLPIFIVLQIARMENILFVAICIFLLNTIENKYILKIALIGFVLAALEVFVYNMYCHANTNLYYWTSSKGYMMLAFYLLVFLITVFKNKLKRIFPFKLIYDNIFTFSFALFLIVTIVFAFKVDFIKENIYVCIGNYLGSGMYSILFMALPLLSLLNNKQNNLISLLISFIVFGFLALFALMLFNPEQMYFGYTTVEMRMILHFMLINIPIYYLLMYSLDTQSNDN